MPFTHIFQEKDLIIRIANGDEKAFEQLYFEYKDRIYAISLRFCKSSEVGEDMVQEIFLKVWLNRDKLTGVEHFRAYLYTITRNHIIRHLKKQARLVHVAHGEMDSIIRSTAESGMADREYQMTLQNAVKNLSVQQAAVYKLSRESGFKREEIAAQMGISPDTVKTHLSQALKNIRAYCLARLDLLLLLIFLKK